MEEIIFNVKLQPCLMPSSSVNKVRNGTYPINELETDRGLNLNWRGASKGLTNKLGLQKGNHCHYILALCAGNKKSCLDKNK